LPGDDVKGILEKYKNGEFGIDEALQAIKHVGYEDLGFAKVDHRRHEHRGFPEVIFAAGKTADQVAQIAVTLRRRNDRLLITRANEQIYAAVKSVIPEAIFHSASGAITVCPSVASPLYGGYVAILSAGTSDQRVVEEAAVTLQVMGHEVRCLPDVGVAGIHRLLAVAEIWQKANVIIVVAGMEGALASVVGGLTDKPVIAVPTSVGYGAHFGGVAPLLAMLNSCAAGVTVVNIDNGFGAGYAAALINRMIAEAAAEAQQ